MSDPAGLAAAIETAFADVPYPGDHFLHSLWQARDADDELKAFAGRADWRALDAAFMDANYTAFSFFSEAALRFYMPAYLRADVLEQLQTADPAFALTYGFSDWTHEHQTGSGTFTRRFGRSVLLGPARYGAMRNIDHARFRLSIFAREEAEVIVRYLRHRRDREFSPDAEQIDAALDEFWLARARQAPTQADLAAHTAEERRFGDAIRGE